MYVYKLGLLTVMSLILTQLPHEKTPADLATSTENKGIAIYIIAINEKH